MKKAEKLISVIVPVYNVEEYLPKCLDSIINQTYKNLEIILVDDGSTDNSWKICDEYAEKDKRISVIHKNNGGQGSARNVGLNHAKGEYITFVDSEDYITEDMIYYLLKFLEDNKLDVAMIADCYVYDKSKIFYPKDFKTIILDKRDDMIKYLFANKYGGASCTSVWGKLYKRDILKDCKFLEGKAYEDAFYILLWINKTKRFGSSSQVKYYYIQRTGSIAHNKLYTNKILDLVEAYEYNLNIIREKYPNCIDIANSRLFWAYKSSIEKIYDCEDYELYFNVIKKLQLKLRKKLVNILNNRWITYKSKIVYILLCVNIKLYFYIKGLYIKNEL